MTRIFIVDDHAVLREGLHMLLAQEPGFEVVGEAANGQELLERLPAVPTDVVLLDMNMPVLGGVATAQRLRADHPQTRVLMLSMVDNPRHVSQALRAGADGYILKNADRGELVVAIQTVVGGKRFLCSEVGLSLLDTMLSVELPAAVPDAAVSVPESAAVRTPGSGVGSGIGSETARAPASGAASLTRRELEIVRLVAEGLTTQQIADQLFTSKRTVETHRQNLLEKTGTNNTAALIRYAMTQGYLS